jgi:chromate transporter
LGFNEIALLFAGGIIVMLIVNIQRIQKINPAILIPLGGITLAQHIPFNLSTLFLTFLKIGSVLYGSGYVLLAFLRNDFVLRLGWLTDQQLLDAVAIGQVTPGPLFTAATFIGYLLGGTSGALLATLGIFLPSFIFVLISNPLIPKIPQLGLDEQFTGWSERLLSRTDGCCDLPVSLLLADRSPDCSHRRRFTCSLVAL